jgi:CHASE2 domain-containing sensor protein
VRGRDRRLLLTSAVLVFAALLAGYLAFLAAWWGP